MSAAAALALAHAHGVAISLDGGDLILESRGPIPPDVRSALKSAKADLLAALRQSTATNVEVEKRVGKDGQARKDPPAKPERALSSDDLLDALRARGFEIEWRGDKDGSLPLTEVVQSRRPLFERLLTWSAPSSHP